MPTHMTANCGILSITSQKFKLVMHENLSMRFKLESAWQTYQRRQSTLVSSSLRFLHSDMQTQNHNNQFDKDSEQRVYKI